ncbi:MAG: MDR family MFS transporter [Caldilineaceae bacterium]
MSSDNRQAQQDESGGLAYKWKVLISVIFGIFMVILDTTIVNIAFRTLQEEFAAGVNESQWIISIYVLALGISTPLSGFLGDRFGMKRTYVTGLGIFILGSFLCGISPSLWLLIGARTLQGFGGGIALPLGTALLFSAFPPREQGTALGIFGIAIVTAPALGPILGGYLVDQGLWRWIFFVNIPIGLLGIGLGLWWLRRQERQAGLALDLWGLIASTIGFGAILYAGSVAADQGWTAPRVLIFFAVGLVGLVTFGLIELFVAETPLLDLRLFQSRVFANAAFVGWVSVVALFGAEFLLPLYLQVLRGRTALETGFILLPLAVAAAIATPVAGRLYDSIGARPLVVLGFSILAVNTWQLSQLTLDTTIPWILFLLTLRGLALGLTVQTTLVTALATVEGPKVSRASALINSTRQVVQSLAVAFLATVLTAALTPGLASRMEQYQQQAPPAATQSSGAPSTGSTNTSTATGATPALCNLPNSNLPLPANVTSDINTFCREYIVGFERAYLWTFYAALLALLLGAFLPGWPLHWEGRENIEGESRSAMAAGDD